ncbi:MAG: flagellar export apparatus protein FliP, partial [Thiomonas sp. 14-64-326]
MKRAHLLRPSRWLPRGLAAALLPLPLWASAQVLPAFTSSPAAGGGTEYSLSVQTLL